MDEMSPDKVYRVHETWCSALQRTDPTLPLAFAGPQSRQRDQITFTPFGSDTPRASRDCWEYPQIYAVISISVSPSLRDSFRKSIPETSIAPSDFVGWAVNFNEEIFPVTHRHEY